MGGQSKPSQCYLLSIAIEVSPLKSSNPLTLPLTAPVTLLTGMSCRVRTPLRAFVDVERRPYAITFFSTSVLPRRKVKGVLK
jgi:hypothetical protein